MKKIILLLCCSVLIACGASAREKTIRTTFDATNIAADHLLTFSDAQEAQINATATSLEDRNAKTAAWRAKVDKAELALTAVYRAIATAALLNDDRSVATLIQVALILNAELHDLGVKP